MQKPARAAIYARYSGHGQTEQSIEGQMRVCREFAAREGMAIVAEYIDRAISGRTDARPEFQRMIADSDKGGFDTVLVYKLDRFSRDDVDNAVYKHRLKERGVRVASATENFGDTPEGELMAGIMERFASYFSRELGQKVRRGKRESAEKGLVASGTPPYGFRVENKQLVVEESEAGAVRRAFGMYAAGAGMQDIVDALHADGARTRGGGRIRTGTLCSWFGKEKYAGTLTYSHCDARHDIPAIVDRATFDAVRDLMAERRRRGAARKAKIPFALSGKALCGLCGMRLCGNSGTGRRGGRYLYYVCGGRVGGVPRGERCGLGSVPKGALEGLVAEATAGLALADGMIDALAADVAASLAGGAGGERDALAAGIAGLEALAEKCVDAMLAAGTEAARRRLEARLADAEAGLAEARARLAALPPAPSPPAAAEVAEWLRASIGGGADRILGDFVRGVLVYEDRVLISYSDMGGGLDIADCISFNETKASGGFSEALVFCFAYRLSTFITKNAGFHSPKTQKDEKAPALRKPFLSFAKAGLSGRPRGLRPCVCPARPAAGPAARAGPEAQAQGRLWRRPGTFRPSSAQCRFRPARA